MWPFTRKQKKIVTGALAPDFALPNVDDRVVRLSQFRGERIVVLVFLRSFL